MDTDWQRHGAWLLIGLLTACDPGKTRLDATSAAGPALASASSPDRAASGPKYSSKLRYSLGIVGYNYTETGILDYSVNGIGAFNVGVSNETSGGGGTVCCFGWVPSMKLPLPIHIEWTRDMKFWCRKTVMLDNPGPLEPNTFEVHFYPDRHIEVAVTDDESPPRLRLASNGGDYRFAGDWRKQEAHAAAVDAKNAECRQGRFPIGGSDEMDPARKGTKSS